MTFLIFCPDPSCSIFPAGVEQCGDISDIPLIHGTFDVKYTEKLRVKLLQGTNVLCDCFINLFYCYCKYILFFEYMCLTTSDKSRPQNHFYKWSGMQPRGHSTVKPFKYLLRNWKTPWCSFTNTQHKQHKRFYEPYSFPLKSKWFYLNWWYLRPLASRLYY